jgi:hypothetical protein
MPFGSESGADGGADLHQPPETAVWVPQLPPPLQVMLQQLVSPRPPWTGDPPRSLGRLARPLQSAPTLNPFRSLLLSLMCLFCRRTFCPTSRCRSTKSRSSAAPRSIYSASCRCREPCQRPRAPLLARPLAGTNRTHVSRSPPPPSPLLTPVSGGTSAGTAPLFRTKLARPPARPPAPPRVTLRRGRPSLPGATRASSGRFWGWRRRWSHSITWKRLTRRARRRSPHAPARRSSARAAGRRPAVKRHAARAAAGGL